MHPPIPSPIPTWHNTLYASINPTLTPSLHHRGKTVIVTGAGTCIGRATCLAFAAAKTAHIVLVGRTECTLRETAALIAEKDGEGGETTTTRCMVFPADVTDAARIGELARVVAEGGGTWDTLILNAATLGTTTTNRGGTRGLLDASTDELRGAFETNAVVLVLLLKTLLPCKSRLVTVVSVGSAAGVLPVRLSPGLGAYVASKAAGAKVVEVLHWELNGRGKEEEAGRGVFITTVQPGVIPTQLFAAANLDPDRLPMDSVELPAGFMVWLAKKGGEEGGEGERVRRALGGRFLYANWDAGEVLERLCGEGGWGKEGRSEEGTVGIVGWPWGMELGL